MAEVGFCTTVFRVLPEDEVRYGLLREEWITIARKPATTDDERIACVERT